MVPENVTSNILMLGLLIIAAQREISKWFIFKLKPPQNHWVKCYEYAPREGDTVYWSELDE